MYSRVRSAAAISWPHLRELSLLLRKAATSWSEDNAMRLSAAVAMYSVLSLSPLLVITVKVVSVVFTEEAATVQLDRQMQALLGPVGAQAVHDMIGESSKPGSGILATGISFVLLLITASAVFAELQDALNTIWRVKAVPERGGWDHWIRNRMLSMAMVFVIGFLLLISQMITTTLTLVSEKLARGEGWASLVVDTATSLTLITILFAMLFRMLPDVRIGWRDVVLGALVTALLFKFGQYVLALYFKYVTTSSAYGAAGSFVAILLWVYYSSWILLFGAEFTKVFARFCGRWVEAEDYATKLTATEQAVQGLEKSDSAKCVHRHR
jgi:membrane protein